MVTRCIQNCVLALVLLLAGACRETAPPTRPNIIVIMADDLGYGGIGCYGEPDVSTPNLDSLAAKGIRFTDFHSNGSVCTPTRAALLTGNYQQRSGMEGVIYVRGETRETGLDTSQVTIAEMLKTSGYATAIMGKWHLGYKKEFNPVNQGFDEFYGYLSGNVDYHSHYDNAGIYDWWHNQDSIREEGYVTDLITRHAVDFIGQHKDSPFFLYVAHEAPHVPFQGRNDTAYRYPGREFTYYGPVEDQKATYREMIEVMDEGVGTIMAALRKNQLEENTLVIFVSDNGAEAFGNNGNLNGKKGDLLEGGHRVPAIAYWKGRIVPRESSETLISMDILPTLLTISGTQRPDGMAFDGTDFSTVLFDGDSLDTRTLFWRYNGQKAARKGPWKLVLTDADTLLYNLDADPGETRNLSGERPDIGGDLLRELEGWEKEMGETSNMKTI